MSTDKKIIIAGSIVTVLILVGAVLLLTKSENINVPEDQIVAHQGLHWHPKVTVTIKGQKQEIPANLGLGPVHGKIHTHDTDSKEGVVHIEAQGVVTKDDTKLGRFFQVWGKDFNSRKIFDQEATAEGMLKMTVNGIDNKDFENYLMKDGDNIEVKYE